MQKSLYFLPHRSLRRPHHWGLHACIFSALAGWGHHLVDSSQVCIVVNRLRFGYGLTVNRLHFLVIVRALVFITDLWLKLVQKCSIWTEIRLSNCCPNSGLGRVPDLRVWVQVRALVICVSTSTSLSTWLLYESEYESEYWNLIKWHFNLRIAMYWLSWLTFTTCCQFKNRKQKLRNIMKCVENSVFFKNVK